MDNDKEKGKKIANGILTVVIILVVVAMLMIVGWLIYNEFENTTNNSQERGSAAIELSTSINRIYLGGSGTVDAILRYDGDGSIESGNFIYESDRPDLLTFQLSEGIFTGKYSVKDKDTEEQFQDTEVTVTVSCADNLDIESQSVSIIVTDALPLAINFYRNIDDDSPVKIDVYQGYSIEKINQINGTALEIPDNRPSIDFDEEWYDKDTGKRINVTTQTAFYGRNELNLYARYRLNKSLKLVDELNGNELDSAEISDEDFQIYYNEQIDNLELLRILKDELSSSSEWKFDGWTSSLNDKDEEAEFKNALNEDKFIAKTNIIQAKWIKNIPVDVIFSTSNEVPSSIDVVYGSNVNIVVPEYYNDGVFVKWVVTDSEDRNTEIESGNKFSVLFPNKISAKVGFPIKLDVQGAESIDIDSTYLIEYGKGIECALPAPKQIVEDGWTFDDWYTGIGGSGLKWDEYIHEHVSNISGGSLTLYAKRTSQLTLHRLLTIYATATEDVENIDVVYNTVVSLPSHSNMRDPQGRTWTYSGYYATSNGVFDGSEQIVERNKPYVGMGAQHLYAKWETVLPVDAIFSTSNIMPTSASIVYNGLINGLPNPQYYNDGILMNWVVRNNNGEEYVIKDGEKYSTVSMGNIYAKVKFPIRFDTQGASSISVNSNCFIEYGKGIECDLPRPKYNIEDGWTFDDWYTDIAGSGQKWDEYVHSSVSQTISGILTLYAKRTSKFTLHRLLDKSGAPTQLTQDINIVYNQVPAIPIEYNTTSGWSFNGYYITENGIFNGSESEVSRTASYKGSGLKHLYAKWTSNISFETDSHLGSVNKTSEVATYNGRIDCPTITYLGNQINSGDISFDGWYTDKYGTGNRLDEEVYTLGAGQTFYDRTLINVYFNDTLNNESNDFVTVIYGKTLNESIGDGIGLKGIPALNDKDNIWSHIGYTYDSGGSKLLDIVTDEDGTYMTKLKDVRYFWTPESPQFNGSIMLNSVWEVAIQYVANKGNITEKNFKVALRYGDVFELPQLTAGSWNVRGWYLEESYGDNAQVVGENNTNLISTTDNYFKELLQNKYKDKVLKLFAKWGTNVTLEFGNGTRSKILDVIYGTPIGDKLPLSKDEIGEIKSGFDYAADGEKTWGTELGEFVGKDTSKYPLNMDSLIYQWKSMSFNIKFQSYSKNGGYVECGDGEKVIKMGEYASLGNSFIPSGEIKPNGWGVFVGFYYFENAEGSTVIGNDIAGGRRYFDNKGNATRAWDIPSDDGVTLYAVYGNIYSVKLDANGGYTPVTQINGLVYGSAMPSNIAPPTREGYEFTGYYTEKDTVNQSYDNKYYESNMVGRESRTWDQSNSNLTLYAGWKIKSYTLTISANGSSKITVKAGNKEYKNGDSVIYGTKLTVTITHGNKNKQQYYYRTGVAEPDKNNTKINTNDITMPAYGITIYANSGNCVTAGTLITLADGSQVPVEQLKGDELLLVWNIYTGKFDVAPILFVDSDPETEYEVINLHFSDGTVVEVISEHGFWDYDLNEWVFLREDAAKYIGHWFNKQSLDENGNFINAKVMLEDVVISTEKTTAWSPVTFGHLCYYVNGMLSMPGATEEIINIFEVDPETLTVDAEKMAEDIEIYGLFTYDDFAEYIPEEVFYAFNGQYLKVAMGKGMLTWEDIFVLIDNYKGFWSVED